MNTYKYKIGYGVSFLVALTAISLYSATARADDAATRGQLSSKDYKFVTEAANGGGMEVSLGQLASQKGQDSGVRDFGQRMVTDHQKANDDLKQLLAQKGATLADTTKEDAKMVERFQNLSGADFDKAYMKQMVSDHKKTVKLFQHEAEKGDDAELKAWVTSTLPTIQEHLHMAEGLQANIIAVKSTAQAN